MTPFLSLLDLARLPLLPFVLLLPVRGFGWAHWDHSLPLVPGEAEKLGFLLCAWAALHAGTLWLNAHLDRDEGEVLFGRAVPVPTLAAPAGYFALFLCVALALPAGPEVAAVAALCVLLSILYSHPACRWKAHPVAGPLVNWLGYGLLSPLAGWLVVRPPLDARSVIVWMLSGLGVLGCYLAAQAFQREADARRGYRTLVVVAGPRTVLTLARIAFGVGFLVGLGLGAVGWLPRLCLLSAPFAVWIDRFLARWARMPDGGSERQARGLVFRLLAGALCTVGLAYADYAVDYFRGGEVCGLATAGGNPTRASRER